MPGGQILQNNSDLLVAGPTCLILAVKKIRIGFMVWPFFVPINSVDAGEGKKDTVLVMTGCGATFFHFNCTKTWSSFMKFHSQASKKKMLSKDFLHLPRASILSCMY